MIPSFRKRWSRRWTAEVDKPTVPAIFYDGINYLAYELSTRGQVEAGIRLLEVGAEMYPRAANLYDSIAELYVGLGRKEKAIEFYTKALEVNPNSPNAANARESLKKLRQQ